MPRGGIDVEGRRAPWLERRVESRDSARGRVAGATAAVVAILMLWWAATALGIWSEVLLPSPAKVWDAFVESVTVHDGHRGLSGHFLWEHLAASLWRILRGLFWALLIGIPLGIALAFVPLVDRVVGPAVTFLRSLPPLGYFALLILWFGIDDTSKVWLLFLACVPPIALGVASGARSVSTQRLEAALTLGARPLQVVRYVVAPSVLPDLLTGARLAVGFAWTTIVAAETSNGIPGIGGLAWATKKELRTDVAVLCVIAIGVTAYLLDAGLAALERRAVPWRGRA